MRIAGRPMPAQRTAAIVSFVAMCVAAAALAPAARSATATTTSEVVIERVAKPGTYAVVLAVTAPIAAETVSVFVAGEADDDISLSPGAGIILAFEPRVRRRTFRVRTVSTGAPATFSVASSLQKKQRIDPRVFSGGSGSETPNGIATGPTGATGATGATGPTGAVTETIVNPRSGPYTRLVWADEFNGPAATAPNPNNWTPDSYGGCGGGTLSTNTLNTANAELDGHGNLAITADGGPSYYSAQLDGAGHLSFEYGEIEARIKIPAGSGLCSAFWLLGDSSAPGSCWPTCGEIDVMEAISSTPDALYATLHGPVAGSDNFQQWQGLLDSPTPFSDGYHTYGLIWQPNLLTWTFDGVPYAEATPSSLPPGAQWVFSGHTFHIMLDLAVGGWPGAPAAGAPFPQTLDINWVRLYR
jgi:beta-glucanase (GH16 family)